MLGAKTILFLKILREHENTVLVIWSKIDDFTYVWFVERKSLKNQTAFVVKIAL